MELKSFSFVAFALVVICLYHLFGNIKYAQSILVLTASIVFIWLAGGIPALGCIICLSALTYCIGILIEQKRAEQKKQARRWMLGGVIFLIAVLCTYKAFHLTFRLSQIGISYYTLSMIAYLLDLYHKKYPAEKNFFYFLTFITYFPSIIEGPINMYQKTACQFKEQHPYKSEEMILGFQRCLWGFVKKVVIADRIGIMVSAIIDTAHSGPVNFLGIALYSFQIYADFSGGIDIIMGISEMLGIRLAENFRSPLLSHSVTEFWQRWHMSLGEFMEKYLYYPIVLGKKTRALSKKIRNKYLQKVFSATVASVIVFVSVGIWHGTGWNYVVYGCYQAFWVSTAILMAPVYKTMKSKLHINDKSALYQLFTILRTFCILMIGRVFTRAGSLAKALSLFRRSFAPLDEDYSDIRACMDIPNVVLLILGIMLLIIVDLINEGGTSCRETILRKHIVVRYCIYYAAIFSILIFGIYGPEYDAASFIYGGF